MLKDLGNEHAKKFINIQSLVAAYDVGKTTKDLKLCTWLFPCKVEQTQIQARIRCSETTQLCPGYSISCALCGMFLPNVCGNVCPIGKFILLYTKLKRQ